MTLEGRLSKAFQTNAPAQGGTYGYDAQDRLASRTFTSGSTTTTTLYMHDINDHIIAETDTAGVTRREYIWLNDLPVAVVDNVNTATPTLYYVHTDHLSRPARMIAQNWAWVWDVVYMPFGAVSAIWDSGSKLDMRFPGQWFQLESGLAYNWHRHYDVSLGRYVQPDPLRVDEREGETVGGVSTWHLQPSASLIDQIYQRSGAQRFGASEGLQTPASPRRSNFPDGPSVYGYSTQNPLAKVDSDGLIVGGGYTSRADSNTNSCNNKNDKDECIKICSDLALPTGDFGTQFDRCMLACMSVGKSGFPYWDKFF